MSQTASLVFFYFGEDSYVRRLAQEIVPLRNALKGYDKQVLLWHQTNFGPFEVSQAADNLADVEDIPTKENLVKYLNELGDEGYVVDLYIFSHGHPGGFLVSKGTYADNGSVSAAHLESQVRPLKLRAVWQCNCWGSTMNETWHKLGAKVTTGSRFINYYPTTFNEFIRHWQVGETFGSAVSKSCDAGARTAPQAFMLVDAASRLKDWAGNIWQAARVLGNNEHAKRYFTRCWDKDFWQDGKSGKQKLCFRVGDSGTRSLLEKILTEEERHLDEAQTNLDQLLELGMDSFLADPPGIILRRC